jgi:hypothetical protein
MQWEDGPVVAGNSRERSNKKNGWSDTKYKTKAVYFGLEDLG